MVMLLTRNTHVGELVIMTCDALGGPGNVFMWTRTLEAVVVGNSSVINITIDSAFDGGVYSCYVSNAAGYEDSSVTINGKNYLVHNNGLFVFNICNHTFTIPDGFPDFLIIVQGHFPLLHM